MQASVGLGFIHILKCYEILWTRVQRHLGRMYADILYAYVGILSDTDDKP